MELRYAVGSYYSYGALMHVGGVHIHSALLMEQVGAPESAGRAGNA
jgi:hypothetical protein